MIATAADYLRFCQMMLNGGALDDVRILGAGTVAHMSRDHLGPTRAMAR
jgi:CubicO group peptidase (beta-lactamase class C family)